MFIFNPFLDILSSRKVNILALTARQTTCKVNVRIAL